jgi:hypothetical protein
MIARYTTFFMYGFVLSEFLTPVCIAYIFDAKHKAPGRK